MASHFNSDCYFVQAFMAMKERLRDIESFRTSIKRDLLKLRGEQAKLAVPLHPAGINFMLILGS